MQLARASCLLSLLLVLAGCPPDEKTVTVNVDMDGDKTKTRTKTKTGDDDHQDGHDDDDDDHGDDDDDGNGHDGDDDDGNGEDLPPWRVIDDAHLKHQYFYPDMKPLAAWPNPVSLKKAPPPREERDRSRVQNLKDLVSFVVHPKFRPRNPTEALGVDSKGRLFMRLGRHKTDGSASEDMKAPKSRYLYFTMVVKDRHSGPHTVASLRKRISRVVAPKLAAELNSLDPKGKPRFKSPPWYKDTDKSMGLGHLDRQGTFGIQFSYLYGYGTDTHVIVHLVQVPHMKAPREPQ